MTDSVERGKNAVRVTCSLVLYQNNPEQVRSCIQSVLSSDLSVRLMVIDNSPLDQLRETVSGAGADYCIFRP